VYRELVEVGNESMLHEIRDDKAGSAVHDFVDLPTPPIVNSNESNDAVSKAPFLARFNQLEHTRRGRTTGQHDHVLEEWVGRIEPAVDGDFLKRASGGLVSIELPGDIAVDLELNRHTEHSADRGSYLGKVRDYEHSRVVLSYSGNAVAGSIGMGDGMSWQLANAGGGEQILRLVDSQSLENCQVCRGGLQQ